MAASADQRDDTAPAAAPASDQPDGPAPDLREVSIDEAIAIAIMLQRSGRLEDAAEVHRKIAAVAPDHPVALHYAGVLAHQQGRTEEGIELIHRSLESDPAQADWYSNLGILLRAAGRVDDAAFAYRQAIALDPRHAKAHNNLGIVLRSQGRPVEAEAEYRAAIELFPGYAEAYHNLGTLLSGEGRIVEAVDCLNKAIVYSPETKETRNLLALAYCALGQRDKAADIYERWLQEEPGSAVARHMLAACSGQGVPERASDEYIEQCFDSFARTFDEKLAHLSYRAPRLVAAALADAGLQPANSLDVLDAGCGTGLCGALIRPYARHLVGVDLSRKMLDEATKRGVYDDVRKAELTEYLRGCNASFDVIVSADTLVYFGALDALAAAAATALRPGGLLVFTLEEKTPTHWATAGPVERGYELQTHGRYGHTVAYVESVLESAGFQVVIVRAELRTEGGVPVKGLLVRATKSAPGQAARGGVNDE